jgi:hypothetical protein
VTAKRGGASKARALEALGRVHYVPIRHHSPRSSAVLRAVLARVSPELVLVEGPSDADALIDVIVDAATEPPIALLGYRIDKGAGSAMWPFARYSPEYVALKWASERGAARAFIDVPIGVALAPSKLEPQARAGGPDPDDDASVHDRAAQAAGFASFESFWEASFEAPAHDPASFSAAILAYADVVRAADGDADAMTRARDAFMARRIEDHASRVEPSRIVVVAGAAHVVALARGEVDLALERQLPKPVPTAATVIPYSFPRLAEQLGYGAGNRAPQHYQRVDDAELRGADAFDRAALVALIELAEDLRLRGFAASLADALEGYRLARTLAAMRGRAAPGLDEVRDAAVATICRGDALHVDAMLWPVVIGKRVGHVAARVGKNSLEEEFWRTVRDKRLPVADALEPFSLRLHNEVEIETSVFLHRLRVIGVPYASFVGGGAAALRDAGHATGDEAGGFAALTRAREGWEAQWTPATDVALVEAIVLGETLEAAADRALATRLDAATDTAGAAEVLLEAVVTSSRAAAGAALSVCERLAALDDDLPSLARAAQALATLVSFGTSRGRTVGSSATVAALLENVWARAVLRAEAACAATDEATPPLLAALRVLHEIALAKQFVDGAGWTRAARRIAASDAVNPACAGHAEGLLYLMQATTDADVDVAVRARLGDALEPRAAARYLEGFLEVNALALVKSRAVVGAIDAFLGAIDPARFTDVLPVLRRAFGHLGATERRYLLENLLAMRRAARGGDAMAAARLARDKAAIVAMRGELEDVLHDVDDLLSGGAPLGGGGS